jgi:Tfp pilus assembly protein PilN
MAQRRINLLPPERAQQRRARQLTLTIIAAGVALVVLLGVIYGAEGLRAHSAQNELKDQLAQNEQLQSQVSQLASYAQKERELNQKTQQLEALTQNEVRWSVIFADVSLLIPSDVWLTNFTGSVSASVGQQSGPGASVAGAIGNIQLTGVTFAHLDVAKWLTRLAEIEVFADPYLSLSSKGVIETTDVVNFNSNVQLSQDALRKNQPGAERPI